MTEYSNTNKKTETSPSILIVDCNHVWLNTFKRIFESCRWKIFNANNESETLEVLSTISPDVILIDYILLNSTGDVLARKIKSQPDFQHIPIAILTFLHDRDIQADVLRSGVDQLITHPINVDQFINQISDLAMKGKIIKQMDTIESKLEPKWFEKVQVLKAKFNQMRECPKRKLFKLMRQAGMVDTESKHHFIKLDELCTALAMRLQLKRKTVFEISHACWLKDIGNAVIPKFILQKPGALDLEERKAMQQHPQVGQFILNHANSEIIQMGASIALSHHEWWNGQGYPMGLQQEEIPLEARITTVADVFLALCKSRPHRTAFKRFEAFHYIKKGSGKQFDPKVVNAFEKTVI